MIKVNSVNIGQKKQISQRGASVTTGIFKLPVHQAVIAELGVEGDSVCDTRHHGGPDQAVYIYAQEDYQWWSEQLGKPVEPGAFGENLTLSELPEICIGDRLIFQNVELEATAPRIPCATFGVRMEDAEFVKKFIGAKRPGVYCRVIRGGVIHTGETGEHQVFPAERISIKQFFEDSMRSLPTETLEHYLNLPIDLRTRSKFEQQLTKAKK
jgi:MOSC domain-containing protein YiiM